MNDMKFEGCQVQSTKAIHWKIYQYSICNQDDQWHIDSNRNCNVVNIATHIS
jgi:hypothetical protein